MKKILTLFCLTALLLTSCNNDDDFDNDTFARTFEVTRTFNAANNFADEAVVPNNVEVFDADVALVFILDPIRSAAEGGDVWEPLPKTFNFAPGEFARFSFNFIFDERTNKASIEFVLESDDLTSLNSDITDNQVFRIVIVPSSFASDSKVDLNDLNAVKSALNLEF
ncbi:hypothetical protein [Aquimarina aggregata]|uniref:hypothetical protein n=1 Tax=Aquimarina aggregata TaxID=1642818 RepID=UPI0024928190|nr:hypothetical protein [Aquimarina aggregata]